MSNTVIDQLLEQLEFTNPASNEVVKYFSTVLIQDFDVPPGFVVDLMHSVHVAIFSEYNRGDQTP